MKPFTMIPNDYLEALMKRELNGRERRVLDCIIRKTHGYRTDKAKISDRDFSRMTDIDRRDVQKVLKSLEEKGLICIYSQGQGKTRNYSLIDISKIESELIPTSFNTAATTGGENAATINKYIYKENTTGGENAATQPPLPQLEQKAVFKAGISKLEQPDWLAAANERMNKHFEEMEKKKG